MLTFSHRVRHRGMNIGSPKVDEFARRLARLTGEDVETTLERAIEERLSRIAPAANGDRHAAIRTFVDRVSQMPVLSGRSADEILGYGPDGLPS
jgi:antitoxin VapB